MGKERSKNEMQFEIKTRSLSELHEWAELGRKAYVMELDPRYADATIERWEKFTGEKAEKLN